MPSIAELQRAIQIAEKIKELEGELKSILGGGSGSGPLLTQRTGEAKKSKRRKMSPEARARIVAAQKKRWAAVRKAKK